MSEHRGRPEEFGDNKRDTFVALLEVGLSRRMAARNLGIAPSTVTKRAARDPHFAAHIRSAENFRDFELLQRVMRHSERSWRAATWLLERIHPEQFAKGNRGKLGKQAPIGPSADEVFDRIILALREELPEETFQRVEERLNHLAVHDFADIPYPVANLEAGVEANDNAAREEALEAPSAAPNESSSEQPAIEPMSVPEMLDKSAEMDKRSREQEALRRYQERRRQRIERRKCRQLVREGRQPAGGFGRPAVDSVRHLPAEKRANPQPAASGSVHFVHPTGELFNTSPVQQGEGELFNTSPVEQREAELFNTSPDVHEKRMLKNVAG
jgi:hypothetical protein